MLIVVVETHAMQLRLTGIKLRKASGRLVAGMLCVALLLLTSGCAINRIAASHLVAAPNQNDRFPAKLWTTHWTNLLARITTNSLRTFTVPVGPSTASLSILEVPPADYGCSFQSSIQAQTDGTKLFSLTLLPQTNSVFRPLAEPATIVMLHGYGMMKESMAPWAFTLAQTGFRVLLVDLRGHGESTGDSVGFGTLETQDLRQMLDYLIEHGLCDRKIGVLGVSYGATLALHLAAADPRVSVAAAIAPYDRADDAISRFIAMREIPVPGRLVQSIAAQAAKRLHIDWEDWSGASAMRGISQPVLLIGGGADPVSTPDDIRAMESSAAGDVRAIVVPELNHYVIGFAFESIEAPIKEWFLRHLPNSSTVDGWRP